MDGRTKQTFLQKRYTDGQQTHEKMFSITNYQKIANKNYTEVSRHPGQNAHHQKNIQTINVGEVWRKGNPFILSMEI